MKGEGGPIVLFYDTIEEAIKEAWLFRQAQITAKPVSISENNQVIHTSEEIVSIGNLAASIQKWEVPPKWNQ